MATHPPPGGAREQAPVSPMLPANAPVLRALELPPLYAISNAAELGVEEFLRRLERALQSGLRLVQLREKNLSREALRELVLRAIALARAHGAKVLLNADVELAQELGADGVQLTALQLAGLRERPVVDWCGASCHNAEELRRAEALGCDFALLAGAADFVPSRCAAAGLGEFRGHRGGLVDSGVCAGWAGARRYAGRMAAWRTWGIAAASGLVIGREQFLFALIDAIFFVCPFA